MFKTIYFIVYPLASLSCTQEAPAAHIGAQVASYHSCVRRRFIKGEHTLGGRFGGISRSHPLFGFSTW